MFLGTVIFQCILILILIQIESNYTSSNEVIQSNSSTTFNLTLGNETSTKIPRTKHLKRKHSGPKGTKHRHRKKKIKKLKRPSYSTANEAEKIFIDLFLRPETTNKLIEQSSNIENEVEEATTPYFQQEKSRSQNYSTDNLVEKISNKMSVDPLEPTQPPDTQPTSPPTPTEQTSPSKPSSQIPTKLEPTNPMLSNPIPNNVVPSNPKPDPPKPETAKPSIPKQIPPIPSVPKPTKPTIPKPTKPPIPKPTKPPKPGKPKPPKPGGGSGGEDKVPAHGTERFSNSHLPICSILNNTEATRFIVLIVVSNSGRLLCMGSIIDESHILTARTCFTEVNIGSLLVIANYLSPYFGRNSQVKFIDKVINHPHQLSMVVLERPLEFGLGVGPIQQMTPREFLRFPLEEYGEDYYIAGFLLSKFTTRGESLLKTDLYTIGSEKVLKQFECLKRIKKGKNEFYKKVYDRTIMFCSAGESELCWTAVGSPTMMRVDGKYVQVGVVYGASCEANPTKSEKENKPELTVHVRVDKFLKWIQTNSFMVR